MNKIVNKLQGHRLGTREVVRCAYHHGLHSKHQPAKFNISKATFIFSKSPILIEMYTTHLRFTSISTISLADDSSTSNSLSRGRKFRCQRCFSDYLGRGCKKRKSYLTIVAGVVAIVCWSRRQKMLTSSDLLAQNSAEGNKDNMISTDADK